MKTFDAEAAESLAQEYLSAGEPRREASAPAAGTKKLMSQGAKKTSSVRQADPKTSPAGASATGYSAFELSIVRDNQPVGASGEYAVTLPLPEGAGSLTPRGARQKNITYTLYHVHNGQAEQLDVHAEGDVLCFTTPSFSTFILQYTVDFEYVDPETGELYAYTLPGGEETPLSGLLSALSVDADLTGSEAIFSDPSLIELTPVSGEDGTVTDWNLRSLMPFDTEEQLTVTLRSGAEVILRVTDEQIVTRVMDAKGDTYEITVTWERDARLPYGAELRVSEVTIDDERYRTFLEESAEALNVPLSSMTHSKLFDISVVDENGVECQPESGVTVKIELIEEAAQGVSDLKVVHFGEDENGVATAEALESATENAAVTFETDGFSLFSLSDFSLADRIFNAIIGDRELYENDDIILTGKMPMLGSVEAERMEIPNLETLVAYDIKIYANPLYKALGITWQPSGEYVQVTVKSDALNVEKADVYLLAGETHESAAEGEDLNEITVRLNVISPAGIPNARNVELHNTQNVIIYPAPTGFRSNHAPYLLLLLFGLLVLLLTGGVRCIGSQKNGPEEADAVGAVSESHTSDGFVSASAAAEEKAESSCREA